MRKTGLETEPFREISRKCGATLRWRYRRMKTRSASNLGQNRGYGWPKYHEYKSKKAFISIVCGLNCHLIGNTTQNQCKRFWEGIISLCLWDNPTLATSYFPLFLLILIARPYFDVLACGGGGCDDDGAVCYILIINFVNITSSKNRSSTSCTSTLATVICFTVIVMVTFSCS